MIMVLASQNTHKLNELNILLNTSGYEVKSLLDYGINDAPDETGVTFAENAYIKAKSAMDLTGLPSIADDSGICVPALNGAPGIYSARYGNYLTDTERNMHLLRHMEDTTDRSAFYACAIVCLFPDGRRVDSYAECHGEVLREPRGSGGFGYDPLFYLPELGKTMAELTMDEKNTISHRAKALNLLGDIL